MAIVPLLKKSQTELKVRGAFTSAGILYVLYRSDWSYDEFVELFSLIREENGGAIIRVDRLPEESLFLKYAKQFWNIETTSQKCVTIPIPDSFETWYISLSRSVRQNYRTSLNRLNTDVLQYSVKSFWNQPMDRERYKVTTKLYCQRLAEHNTDKLWIQKLLTLPLRIMKSVNPMSKTFLKTDNCFDVELFIQDELAAVCCGYISCPSRAIVPCFFIKQMNDASLMNLDGIEHIDQLDLSRGAEKYKYNYGGIEYYIYGFEVSI